MARFRGTVQGSRGAASRLGGTTSGMRTTCNGWQSGVRVVGHVNDDGDDVFHVYATGGSGPAGRDRLIATVRDGVVEIADQNGG